jgi:glycine/D-amino acid oxidase-like deaminating enzyme
MEISGRDSGAPKTLERIRTKRVVNCAGPWASEIAKILHYPSPSFPVRRQISLFDCRDVDLTPYGMIVDTSGVYFHPEATNGLSGFATPREPAGVNFEYDGESFFMEHIWPALYERSSSFERLRHLGGWAGLYECSPDESAILGKVELGRAGSHGGVYEAHSFSGHGAMHSFAAGRALAELLTAGRFETIDVSILTGRRFETGQLVHEGLVI